MTPSPALIQATKEKSLQRLPVDDAALAGIGAAMQEITREFNDLAVRKVGVIDPHQAPDLCVFCGQRKWVWGCFQ